MVDNHPSRHDPSHIVTHRIQCAISQFADYLITACSPLVSSKWKGFLQALNTVVCNFVDFASPSLLQFMNLHIMSISPIGFKYENILQRCTSKSIISVSNASDFPVFTFLHFA